MLSRLDLQHVPATRRLPDRLGFLGAVYKAPPFSADQEALLAYWGNALRALSTTPPNARGAVFQLQASLGILDRMTPRSVQWIHDINLAVDHVNAGRVVAAREEIEPMVANLRFFKQAAQAGGFVGPPTAEERRPQTVSDAFTSAVSAGWSRRNPIVDAAYKVGSGSKAVASAVADAVATSAKAITDAFEIPWYLWVAGAVGLGAVVYVGVVRR